MINKRIIFLTLLTIAIFTFIPQRLYPIDDKINVKIESDWFYVNGEKFLVKGVAYSPWRPGQLPWSVRPDCKKMEEDFKNIKEAGFNTVRTWSPLTEEEVLLAKKYSLMVIQGIWVDPIADPLRSYRDPNVISRVNTIVSKEIKRFKDYDNILMFLVGNEIPIEGVMKSGLENTEKMLKRIKKTVKETDSRRYVSFANWPQVSFLDHSFWDVVCFNVYSYFPVTISHSMGFYGYISWLKTAFSKRKPLLITEYGLSVSPKGPGKLGYGGNSLEEQKDGCISLWDSLLQSGSCGGCIFEWNDEWWKNYESKGDEDSHDDQPEEWFGILGIEGVNDNYTEKLRPAYYAMKEYNQAIIIEPNKCKFYDKSVPIEIYSTENVCNVIFKIDDSEWENCRHASPHWWKAKWKGNDKELKSHTLKLEATDKENKIICKKETVFWAGLSPKAKQPEYIVSIDCKDRYASGKKSELIKVVFKVTDENNKPINGIPVKYSFYETRLWEQAVGEKTTDDKGLISVDYYIREPGYIIVSAGTDYQYKDFKKRCGNIKFIEVTR